MRIRFAVLLQCILLLCTQSVGAVNIEMVTVGNPGNAPDATRLGRVDYEYRIGKYEVTIGQYAEFLNAVAATDTYSLYDPGMGQFLGSQADPLGIIRNGNSGGYSYQIFGPLSRPIYEIDWWRAARFVNWLQNGQPSGLQNASTTEEGTYALTGVSTDSLTSVPRNPDAKWFLPSLNEWYKTAYYQPADQGGDTDSYWHYPTRSNAEPNSDEPPGDPAIQTNVANFYRSDGLPNGYNDGPAIQGDDWVAEVGSYVFAPSYFGTYDQGGNVAEWTDTTSRLSGPVYLLGGGSGSKLLELSSSIRLTFLPLLKGQGTGFRIAAAAPVPELTSLALFSLAAVMLGSRRRR
jgi:formylglycine-generating enzyme required for sulfatase activity